MKQVGSFCNIFFDIPSFLLFLSLSIHDFGQKFQYYGKIPIRTILRWRRDAAYTALE